ncbi:hypothetical protein FOA52_008921 [Chlamydomonas sp. UWO 241]|nr:hypothetical protein FOA52_008921 [Chlamydomonas sp. UWO 241]
MGPSKLKWSSLDHRGGSTGGALEGGRPHKKQKQKQQQAEQEGDNGDDAQEELLMRIMGRLDKTKDAAKRAKLETKMQRLMGSIAASGAAAGATASKAKAGRQSMFWSKGGMPASTPNHAGSIGKGLRLTPAELRKREQRALRFEGEEEVEEGGEQAPLLKTQGVGTSMAIEKEYLRLTSLPSASSVRPPTVLKLALDLVKARWREASDYEHACAQLKSIRQDLTVQHVRDKLTVDAYETHGRIALEVSDMAEFRQCHSVLKQLYKEGVAGQRQEFTAYGLLFAQSTGKGTMLVSELPTRDLEHPYVDHALRVCRAFRQGDYAAFGELYASAPRMAPYLMDRLLPRLRAFTMQAMITAYRPSPVPLSYLGASLVVEQDGADVIKIALEQGGVIDTEEGVLDTKSCRPRPMTGHKHAQPSLVVKF